MKRLVIYVWLKIVVVVILRTVASFAAELPPQIYSINNAIIGVTTLNEVRSMYGIAEGLRIGKEDEADMTFCYMHPSQQGESYLIFESSVMGAFKVITGFRISILPQSGGCISTKTDIGTLATCNGVWLGQRLEEFKKSFPVQFKYDDSKLTYEAVNQRAATEEELKRLRTNWPNEKRDYFDVTTIIEAKFRDNKLIDYYVHKIESY